MGALPAPLISGKHRLQMTAPVWRHQLDLLPLPSAVASLGLGLPTVAKTVRLASSMAKTGTPSDAGSNG